LRYYPPVLDEQWFINLVDFLGGPTAAAQLSTAKIILNGASPALLSSWQDASDKTKIALAVLAAGQFSLSQMPRAASGFLHGKGVGADPAYEALVAADIPSLDTSKITTGRFTAARLLDGTSGYFLKAQGAGVDPIYALLVAADIPNLDTSKLTTGLLAIARGGLNNATWTALQLVRMNAGGTAFESSGKTIADFAAASHTHAATDITSARLALARLPDAAINKFIRSQGVGSDPIYDTLVAADIPSLDVAKIVSGVFAEARGGTNQSGYTLGDLLYASALNTLAKLAGNITTTRKFLRQVGNGSVSAAPAWDTLQLGDLPAHKDTHKTSGSDAFISSDLLDGIARVKVRKNTGEVDVGARRRLNLIEGNNVTLTVADDPTDEDIDVTIQANVGAAGSHNLLDGSVHPDTTAGTVVKGDIVTGQGVTPKWTRKGLGGVGTYLRSDGADLLYSLLVKGDIDTALALTQGSIPFAGAGGAISQDNANLFWDSTNKRLGIGTPLPTYDLVVSKNTAGWVEFQVVNLGAGDAAFRMDKGNISVQAGTNQGSGFPYFALYPDAAHYAQLVAIASGDMVVSFAGGGTSFLPVVDATQFLGAASTRWNAILAGLRLGVVTKTNTNYTILGTDAIVLVSTGNSARTMTLPAASQMGQILIIKKIDAGTGTVIVSRAGADTIQGATTKTLAAVQYNELVLYADGVSTWYIMTSIGTIT
jgi:hypothetical protein